MVVVFFMIREKKASRALILCSESFVGTGVTVVVVVALLLVLVILLVVPVPPPIDDKDGRF